MKILYIDINEDNIIRPSEEIEVYSYHLIDDFFFFIGEKIAREYAEEDINLIRLVADYEKESGSTPFTEQWKSLKSILLGKGPQGVYALTLPKEYLTWLKFSANTEYRNIYNEYYKDMQSANIEIDLKDLYDDSVALMIGEVCRYLDRNADKGLTHLGFDESISSDSLFCQQITNSSNLCFSSFNTSNIKEAGSFYNGRALLRRGTKVGFINHRGEIIVEKEYDGPYKIVDLGLSVCWADCNLGASSPEEDGDYFDRLEKCAHGSEDATQVCISGTSYDVAHVRLGDNWRMPAKDEMEELFNCKWQPEEHGFRVIGPNGNSIMLSRCFYCSGTYVNNEGWYMKALFDNAIGTFITENYGGHIRPVLEL